MGRTKTCSFCSGGQGEQALTAGEQPFLSNNPLLEKLFMWSFKKGTHPCGPFCRKRKTWFCIIWNCFAKSWFRTRHTFIVSFLHAPWYFPLPGATAHPGTKANTLGAVTDWNVDLHPESGIGINSIQIPTGADKPASDLKYIFFSQKIFMFHVWRLGSVDASQYFWQLP